MTARARAYDLVVLGLGGMGSATLAAAAGGGRRVLGIDARARGHAEGSSTGRSRIVRKAYFEGAAYVPLLRRAFELWHALEAASGETLLDLGGVLFVGGPESELLGGILASCAEHALDVERLSRDEVLARYPAMRLRAEESGVFERDAGAVRPERAIAAELARAEAAGAETRFETPVASYASRPDGVHVALATGETIVAERLALCAGPWLAQLARELALPLRVERNVQLWFSPTTQAYASDRFPVYFADRPDAYPALLYGFPDYGDGVKAGFHGSGESASPDAIDRTVRASDVAPVRAALDGFMPGAAGELRDGKVCSYTMTPDGHFLLAPHPGDARIVVAGGFSGHGFKFCPVVGEIVAELAFDGRTRHDVGFLGFDRLPALAGAAAREL